MLALHSHKSIVYMGVFGWMLLLFSLLTASPHSSPWIPVDGLTKGMKAAKEVSVKEMEDWRWKSKWRRTLCPWPLCGTGWTLWIWWQIALHLTAYVRTSLLKRMRDFLYLVFFCLFFCFFQTSFSLSFITITLVFEDFIFGGLFGINSVYVL